MIKVAIAGARGKMGIEAVHTMMKQPDITLVSVLDYKEIGATLRATGLFTYDVPVYTDMATLVTETKPDVLIDLTSPQAVYANTKQSLQLGVRPVVGTTGFTDEQLIELTALAETSHLGCIIAPNFALGAVLMMKFAREAARYFPDVEVIEMHHDQKLDAPSGTGIKTMQMMQEVRDVKQQGHPDEHETIAGARGGNVDGMRIHSVRLPGLVAHQQVLFGGDGQLLTLRHDSFNRGSFMSGVVFCVEQVMTKETLVYGLENIL